VLQVLRMPKMFLKFTILSILIARTFKKVAPVGPNKRPEDSFQTQRMEKDLLGTAKA